MTRGPAASGKWRRSWRTRRASRRGNVSFASGFSTAGTRPNHALLSSDAAEKKTSVYESVRRKDQWASSDLDEDSPLHKIWTKDEVDFDLCLDKFGVKINMDAEDERAIFKNFVEDWEEESIKKRSKSNEHLLLKK